MTRPAKETKPSRLTIEYMSGNIKVLNENEEVLREFSTFKELVEYLSIIQLVVGFSTDLSKLFDL